MRDALLEWSRLLLARFSALSDELLPGRGQSALSSETMNWLRGAASDDARTVRARAIDDELTAARDVARKRALEDGHGRWGQLFNWVARDAIEADLLCLLIAIDASPRIASSVRLLSQWPEAAGIERAFLQAVLDPFGAEPAKAVEVLRGGHRLVRLGVVRGLNQRDPSRAVFADAAPAVLSWLSEGVQAACTPLEGIDWAPADAPDDTARACLDAFGDKAADDLATRIVGHDVVRLHGGSRQDAEVLTRLTASRLGIGVAIFDATKAPQDRQGWRAAAREAALMAGLEAGWLVVKGLETSDAELAAARKNNLAQLLEHIECPVILIDEAPNDVPGVTAALTSQVRAVSCEVQFPDTGPRRALWAALGPKDANLDRLAGFALGVAQIRSIATSPEVRADPTTLEEACRNSVSHRVGTLAERVRSVVTWDDIVLPQPILEVAQQVLVYAREAERVFDRWGYGAKHAYGIGLSALFSGPPGTGKTMLAGLVASELGIDLFKIDLSKIVSKYIGETEERLARLFEEASRGGVALLFDEADSLFAKRTNVTSSTDRYANLEVNFLLQKMEDFDGVVFLTTNMPDSLDEAFKRRIRFHARFPLPDVDDRERLWRALTPSDAPISDNVDFGALAAAYEFSGGDVKNASLRAAFYAAGTDGQITLELLDKAAQVECRERGRLALRSAFDFV